MILTHPWNQYNTCAHPIHSFIASHLLLLLLLLDLLLSSSSASSSSSSSSSVLFLQNLNTYTLTWAHFTIETFGSSQRRHHHSQKKPPSIRGDSKYLEFPSPPFTDRSRHAARPLESLRSTDSEQERSDEEKKASAVRRPPKPDKAQEQSIPNNGNCQHCIAFADIECARWLPKSRLTSTERSDIHRMQCSERRDTRTTSACFSS